MDKTKTKKVWRTVILTALIFALTALAVSGAIVLFSSHVFQNGNMTTATLGTEAKVEFSADSAAADVSFAKGGEQHSFVLSMKNSAEGHLYFRYELTHNASSDLASAILVHYDGQFVGTLGELCSIGDGYVGSAALGSGFVAQAQTDTSHTLTLELHEATPQSYYDGKSLAITLTAYTESIDYQKYIFVTNENEFSRAVDDVNSGALTDPCIVLGQSVTLTQDYALSYPATIELCGNLLELGGHTLTLNGAGRYAITSLSPCKASALSTSGTISLDHAQTLLDIADISGANDVNVGALYGNLVSLQQYDSTAATTLLLERMAKTFAGGVYAGESVQLFGAVSFYAEGLTVTAEYGTLNAGALTLPAATATAQCRITVNGEGNDLTVIGSNDAALEQIKQTVLAHLPTDEYQKITSDLFLPSAAPDYNATITWFSANESTISSVGEISNVVKDNEPVTLYAYVRINDTVHTVSYSFHVSSQNNETKFSYLVAQLSPIILDTVYERNEDKGTDNAVLAHHYLPIVGDDSDYDYRRGFITPSARSSPYVWLAYKDIGLAKLEYSISTNYNYVTVESDQNGNTYAYLNTAVFYDYAQINIKGTFKNGEEYEGLVNVTISLGDDADLQNKVFRYVESVLNEVDVLQNILDTRAADGMLYERGDFYLPPRYMTYTINYSIPDSSINVISEIVAPGATGTDGAVNESDMYLIKVDPAYFYSSDTAVGIKVTITPESSDISSDSRILYFDVPPVIKPDESGFNNMGVFNAVKYQIYQQLPADERDGASGFTLSGSTLQNKTGAYILHRDAAYPTTLTLHVKKDTVTTDNSKLYTLMRLIEWATGNTKGVAASSVWSSGGSTESDGQEFLTEAEVTVIKNYWRSATGSNISDTLWNTAFQKAIGRVITNGDILNGYIKSIGLKADLYFKYVEMLNFALDKQNFGKPAGGQWDGSPPNLGTLLRQYTFYGDGTYRYDATATSSYGKEAYMNSKYYTNSYYQEDQSPYISEAEAELLRALVLNLAEDRADKLSGNNATAVRNAGSAYVKAFDQYVVIPTYLNAGGIGLLTAAFYEALGIEADDFTSEITTLNGYQAPSVVNLDNSLTALQYLTGLTKLYIHGELPSGTDTGLAAFLSTSGLSGFFNHITANNQSFTDLEMTLVARNYVTFDITFTERLTKLTHLNYAQNAGITNVGPLVNLPMQNIQYLNIAGVDVSLEFSDYVMANIYAATNGEAEIWYYPDGTTDLTCYDHKGEVEEGLTYLNEIGQIKSEYLQLCPSITTGEGNKDIYWRIESGNMIAYVTVAGELATIPAVENYYYCTTSFTTDFGSFTAGHIYALQRKGNSYFTDLGAYVAVQGGQYDPFTDAEKDNAPLLSSTQEEKNQGTTTSNATVDLSNNDNPPSYTNHEDANGRGRYTTITVTVSGSMRTKTISNVVYFGCDRRIQKTVIEEITITRSQKWQATKNDVAYYDASTGTVVSCSYTYLRGTQYTQTYERTTIYYSYDYYYKINGSDTKHYLSASSDYKNWTKLAIRYYTSRNNTTTATINFSETEAVNENSSSFDENNFVLVPGSVTESVSNTTPQTLISPVGQLSSIAQATALRNLMADAIKGGRYYRYTGNTQTVEYYNNSTTRAKRFDFTRNATYRISVDNNGFVSWTAGSPDSASVGANGMDAFLTEANNHLNDSLYGMYYGMYFAYNGATFTTALGNSYQSKHIYRLLIGDDGRFYFEDGEDDSDKMGIKNTFTVVQSIDGAGGLLEMALNATAGDVGDIYYYEPDGTNYHYHQPNIFYVITRSETGDYFAKTFGCVDAVFEQENNGSYTLRFHNQRIYYPTNISDKLYSGTGGTEYAVISALVETETGFSMRKFLVKVTG